MITAALITDLAQGHFHQNTAVLMEDLNIASGNLYKVIYTVFNKISSREDLNHGVSPESQPITNALARIFCFHSITHIQAYLASKRQDTAKSTGQSSPSTHSQLFLRFFDEIRAKKWMLPVQDKFTEDLLGPRNTSDDWLAFGFQMISDIQQIIYKDYDKLFKDFIEHSLDIAGLIRLHVEYEDRMWNIGEKPDYMCKDDFKFSTVLLHPLNTILSWLQTLVGTDRIHDADSKMTSSVFMTIHPTLAGLVTW